MAQHDYVIANSTGANVRADINSVLQAIATNNSGSSAPSTTVATQFFADTNAGIMKLRNTANSGYVNLFTLAGGIDVDAASNFNEDVTFTGASANIVFDKSDNALEFADAAKATFGAAADMVIQHDGTNSELRNNTGQFKIRADSFRVFDAAQAESIIKGNLNGNVELYYDASKKFETNSAGIQVTGNMFIADGSASTNKVTLGTGGDLNLYHDSSDSYIDNVTGNLNIRVATNELAMRATPNGSVNLYHNAVQKLNTSSGGVEISGNLIASGNVDANSNGSRVSVGDNADLLMTHINNGLIDCVTGELEIVAQSNIFLKTADSESAISCDQNSEIKLFFDNAQKFATKSYGAAVTGNFVTTGAITIESGNDLFLADNGKVTLGTGADFKIFHDGTNNIVSSDGSGQRLTLQSNGSVHATGTVVRIKDENNSETMAEFTADQAVDLYYDNTVRLNTLTNGAQCRGIMHVLSLDGNVNQHTESLYFNIGTNSSTTFTFSSLIGSARIVLGGYANAGQGALGFYVILAGAMFATQHYQVNELINSGMQNISVSTTKNNTSYVVTISNSSSSSSLGISGFIESTGSRVTVATS